MLRRIPLSFKMLLLWSKMKLYFSITMDSDANLQFARSWQPISMFVELLHCLRMLLLGLYLLIKLNILALSLYRPISHINLMLFKSFLVFCIFKLMFLLVKFFCFSKRGLWVIHQGLTF